MRAGAPARALARVDVGDRAIGAIAHGLLVLVGVEKGDTDTDAARLADKLRRLRIFEDDGGDDGKRRMNRWIAEVGGGVLVVSQFTLAADCRRGRRPSFERGGAPTRRGASTRSS